jgi:hypothetical protein
MLSEKAPEESVRTTRIHFMNCRQAGVYSSFRCLSHHCKAYRSRKDFLPRLMMIPASAPRIDLDREGFEKSSFHIQSTTRQIHLHGMVDMSRGTSA